MTQPTYDTTLFLGTAAYYTKGRPPYSDDLTKVLGEEVRLDGTGRLLDVGCGPGTLALRLAGHFESVVAVDPDADMLLAGEREATVRGIDNVEWLQARAEDLADHDLGLFRLVTFGQSFHWTNREAVAEAVYELLEPGGVLALITHAYAGRPVPPGPGEPPIPHEAIRALIAGYLGERRRAGRGLAQWPEEPFEAVLARTRFRVARTRYAPGRADLVQDADGVVANYFSTSFCAPHQFGARREAFEAELRSLLATCSETGRFRDWPGDTELVIARKEGSASGRPVPVATILSDLPVQG